MGEGGGGESGVRFTGEVELSFNDLQKFLINLRLKLYSRNIDPENIQISNSSGLRNERVIQTCSFNS